MGELSVEMGKVKTTQFWERVKPSSPHPTPKYLHHSWVKILEEQALDLFSPLRILQSLPHSWLVSLSSPLSPPALAETSSVLQKHLARERSSVKARKEKGRKTTLAESEFVLIHFMSLDRDFKERVICLLTTPPHFISNRLKSKRESLDRSSEVKNPIIS